MNRIERPTNFWVWLKRFRKRRGYGVHSPFAFNFITTVIYQKGVYYNYSKIKSLPKDKIESDRLCRLLFRLVNYQQPKNILYSSPKESLKELFAWAKSDVKVFNVHLAKAQYDFVYLVPTEKQLKEKDIETIFEQITSKSILVIYGVGYSSASKGFWKTIISHPNSGISFDLYDFGILFFDKEKNKQDYVVNF